MAFFDVFLFVFKIVGHFGDDPNTLPGTVVFSKFRFLAKIVDQKSVKKYIFP